MERVNAKGIIDGKTAFVAYIALAGLAIATLDGDSRKVALAVLGLFAVKTYVDIVRRRIEASEDAEASAATATAATPAPSGDVSSGNES